MTTDPVQESRQRASDSRSLQARREARTQALRAANFLLVLLSVLAAASLIAEYGFYLTEQWEAYTVGATQVVMYGFLVHLGLRVGLTPERLHYLRTHRIEIAVGVLILIHILFPNTVASIVRSIDPAAMPEVLARVYIVVTQIIVVAAFIPAAARYSARVMDAVIQPSSLIAVSFLIMILAGAGLLLLPRASGTQTFSFVDALFTSVSAVCVTGLTVVDTAATFTRTGHVILLFLIQCGGLGIMTLTTFFAFMAGGRGSLKQYSTMQSLLGEESIGKIRSVVLQIGMATLLIEAVGAIAIWFSLEEVTFASPRDRVFFSIFHSVSAFCNAGFALPSDGLAAAPLQTNTAFLSTIMILIVLGGLGFPVLLNIWRMLPGGSTPPLQRRISLHTLLVLIATGILIVAGTAGIFLIEQDGWLAGLSGPDKLFTALFHSVSARTAGFNTLPIGGLAPASLLLFIGLMWIGASPGSTGGGIKTTTAVIAVLAIRSIVTGRPAIEAFKHRVPDRALFQAFSTITLSVVTILLALFVLLLLETFPFTDLLFEVVSALGTVGLSVGITPYLSTAGKLVVALVIFIGRVGVLATLLALTGQRAQQRFEYTEEPVHIT